VGKAIDSQKEKNNKSGVFQKFLLWVMIPLLIIVFLSLLIASLTGINVFEKAKESGEKVPILSYFFNEKEMVSIEEFNKSIIELEAQVEEKNAKIAQLEKKVEEKEPEIDLLLQDKKRLEHSMKEQEQIENDNKKDFKEITSVYESMAPKRAASILLEMKENEALTILSNLAPETLAKILEKMPPDKAASFTQLLTVEASEGR